MDSTIIFIFRAGVAINVGTADPSRLPVVDRRWQFCLADPALTRSLESLANFQSCQGHRLYDI